MISFIYAITAMMTLLLTLAGTAKHDFEVQAIGTGFFIMVCFVYALMNGANTASKILWDYVNKQGIR